MKNFNFKIILPIFVFVLITLPFVNTLPYLDGNIDFVQASDFYVGGMDQYFNNWNTVHPPLKLILLYPSFLVFGPSQLIYNLIGIVFGVIGICSIYLLTKKLSDEKTALLAAFFLSIYPLFIANSIFAMRDLILTSLILLSLYFYGSRKYILYSLIASLSLLTKETGILIPIIIIFTEFLYLFTRKTKFNKEIFIKFFLLFIPLLTYSLWKVYLSLSNKNSWGEWIFTDNENKSAIYTIFNNFIVFDFINPYTQAHLKQLVFLNFNWIYILIILSVFIFLVFKNGLKINSKSENFKTVFVIISFVIIYTLAVLTLQTYTIPRYALPVIPFIIIGLSKSITQIKNVYFICLVGFLVILLLFISSFKSIDPVATYIWGRTEILNHNIYALNEHMAGNDGITYNLQYLLIADKRSDILKNSVKSNEVKNPDCRWIFPDPNNEIKMLETLKLNLPVSCN